MTTMEQAARGPREGMPATRGRWAAAMSHWLLGFALLGGVLAAPARAYMTLEFEVDRPGADYRSFDVQADPLACQRACAGEARCKAFTYVPPGASGGAARCYLKDPAPALKRSDCCTSGLKVDDNSAASDALSGLGFEAGTDRPGNDYANLEVSANPAQCRQACAADARCKAYTYVPPGSPSASAHCYLKDPAPAARPNACCTSGARLDFGGATGQRQEFRLSLEPGTDRPGNDYGSMEIGANPALCRQACAADNRCQAYTYVRPESGGTTARCYLKDPAPAPRANECCTSGTRTTEPQRHVLATERRMSTEPEMDRPGADYSSFEAASNPAQCRQACAADNRCQAYTYVKPPNGVSGARCYLKDAAPAARRDTCCISGTVTGGSAAPANAY